MSTVGLWADLGGMDLFCEVRGTDEQQTEPTHSRPDLFRAILPSMEPLVCKRSQLQSVERELTALPSAATTPSALFVPQSQTLC